MQDAFNHKLQREQQYDTKILTETICTTVPQLNEQQRIVYDSFIQAGNSGAAGI